MPDFRCSLCDFTTKKETGIKIHIGKKHKVEDSEFVRNPEYDGYLAKQTCGKCIGIFDCKKTNQCIIFIHCPECWSFYNPCSDFAIDIPDDDSPVEDNRGKLHTSASTLIQKNLLDWEHLYRLIVGYSLGS